MYFKRLTGLSEILKFLASLLVICIILLSTDLLWRADQIFYDINQRLIAREAPSDVLIVAIDEASLSHYGRWPWRRKLHSELVERLTSEGARIIALDIIFAERDLQYPEDDTKLVEAVKESGKVVLPVIVEQAHRGSVLHETLPFAELSQASAGLGHVHVELDPDGIARSLYLKEGLGKPRWPSLNLVMLQLVEPTEWNNLLSFKSYRNEKSSSLYKWIRDYHVKIPFYGPPGHFQTVSYQQVLKGHYPKGLFTDRVVFVGVTATGLGDSLPTPVSGLTYAMPGVEVNANIFSGLRAGLMIQDIAIAGQYLISIFLISLPALLFPFLRPRMAFIITLILLVVVISISFILVRSYQVWFAPVSALLTIALSYPIWSWRRLEYTLRYMDSELTMLDSQTATVTDQVESKVEDKLNFISTWLPISGLLITDKENNELLLWGDYIELRGIKNINNEWNKINNEYYCSAIEAQNSIVKCCFSWNGDNYPPEQLFNMLGDMTKHVSSSYKSKPVTSFELIQKRIQEVHSATKKLSELKQFIESCLDQIADAVIVLDNSGTIILSNERAKYILGEDFKTGTQRITAKSLFEKVDVGPKWTWEKIFSNIFEHKNEIQLQGYIRDSFDLLISISLLHLAGEFEGHAFIVSMTDITELMKSERKRNEALTFLSHDLRSPLVSILALTELIEQDSKNTGKYNNLKRIEQHARRSIKLAEDFVQFSRAEGNDQILFSEVNLIDVVLNAIDQVWEQANSKNIKIEKFFSDQGCYLNGNAQLLERVFINILTNAIKYSKDHSQVSIELNSNDHIRCIIEDQGIGIPKEDLPTIMNRFQRAESKQHEGIQGIGLGLAFVKVVVEKHGGKINIESDPGQGTKISIDFPK